MKENIKETLDVLTLFYCLLHFLAFLQQCLLNATCISSLAFALGLSEVCLLHNELMRVLLGSPPLTIHSLR